MDTTLKANLIKALEYEEMLIGSLLAVSREKADLLIRNRPLELPALTHKEQQLTDQMQQLEKVRMQLNQKAAEALGMSDTNPTMTALCECMGDAEGAPIRQIRDRMRKAMDELKRQNALNAELLKQSMDFVNFNLQLLAKPTASIPRYGRGGRDLSDNAPTRSIMDLRS